MFQVKRPAPIAKETPIVKFPRSASVSFKESEQATWFAFDKLCQENNLSREKVLKQMMEYCLTDSKSV